MTALKDCIDKYLPGWANEPELFVRVGRIPNTEIWEAHMEAKKILFAYVQSTTGVSMDPDILTIGFARRATAYKRADLIFTDVERLERIGNRKLQIIYAGKSHPKDTMGKKLIEKIFTIKERLKDSIKMSYLQNYDMDIALAMVSGVDIWLNRPNAEITVVESVAALRAILDEVGLADSGRFIDVDGTTIPW